MSWEIWAGLVVLAVVIVAWWIKNAVSGARRTVRLGGAMTRTVKDLQAAQERRGEHKPPSGPQA